jgi:hypothetical protein
MRTVTARTAPILSRDNVGAFAIRFLTVLPRLHASDGLLACLALNACLAMGLDSVDRLLHERPALSDAAIHLLRQQLEALVTKPDRLLLPFLRDRRRYRQLISRM